MFGAIIGDIIGSSREFGAVKTERFELFPNGSRFTDDSVLTIASMDALLNNKDFGECYHDWGKRYPKAGYGHNFEKWLECGEPCDSFGNGSAMRVSPVGYVCESLEDTLKLAEKSAVPSHNHIEGIKGAKAVAGAIYIARTKKDKKEIKKFIEQDIGYNLITTVDALREIYTFDATCQGSVPESIICFMEGNSYEDVVRKAVSLGGDSDTQACIASSIAEAYYGVPNYLVKIAEMYLPEEMVMLLFKFYEKYLPDLLYKI